MRVVGSAGSSSLIVWSASLARGVAQPLRCRASSVNIAGISSGGHLPRGTGALEVLRSARPRGGADLESLRANLGHSDVKVTAMYLNATDEFQRAVARLDRLFPAE
jgi:hypothetical protein